MLWWRKTFFLNLNWRPNRTNMYCNWDLFSFFLAFPLCSSYFGINPWYRLSSTSGPLWELKLLKRRNSFKNQVSVWVCCCVCCAHVHPSVLQIVGCDHELGSTAKEDNCGVCNGDGSSCRLVRGHYKSQHTSGKSKESSFWQFYLSYTLSAQSVMRLHLSLSVCPTPAEDTVVVIPYKSRHVRLVLKGPDHLCKSW